MPRIIRRHPAVLQREEALLAPVYFGKQEMAAVIIEELLRAFRKPKYYHGGLYGLLHWFGDAQMMELERDVLRYLEHPREDVRYAALMVLTTHWKLVRHRRQYERLLRHDKAPLNRSLAASGLGFVLTGTRDIRASRLLARKVREQSEELVVRRTAYDSLRDIWVPRRRRRREEVAYSRATDLHQVLSRNPMAWEAWVDWGFVSALGRGKVPPGFTATAGRRRRAARRRAN